MPARHAGNGITVVIGFSPRVLLGDVRAELDLGAHCRPEWFVRGQACLAKRLHRKGYDALPLLLSDLPATMDSAHVLKT
jgi:hypothetical protein